LNFENWHDDRVCVWAWRANNGDVSTLSVAFSTTSHSEISQCVYPRSSQRWKIHNHQSTRWHSRTHHTDTIEIIFSTLH
jgi:hypothetical protein